jgi:hypothetical protein
VHCDGSSKKNYNTGKHSLLMKNILLLEWWLVSSWSVLDNSGHFFYSHRLKPDSGMYQAGSLVTVAGNRLILWSVVQFRTGPVREWQDFPSELAIIVTPYLYMDYKKLICFNILEHIILTGTENAFYTLGKRISFESSKIWRNCFNDEGRNKEQKGAKKNAGKGIYSDRLQYFEKLISWMVK